MGQLSVMRIKRIQTSFSIPSNLKSLANAQIFDYHDLTLCTISEFITRATAHAQECKFAENDLKERIIELVIVSTPYSAFQKDLDKPESYTLEHLLKDGKKHL